MLAGVQVTVSLQHTSTNPTSGIVFPHLKCQAELLFIVRLRGPGAALDTELEVLNRQTFENEESVRVRRSPVSYGQGASPRVGNRGLGEDGARPSIIGFTAVIVDLIVQTIGAISGITAVGTSCVPIDLLRAPCLRHH